MKLTTENLSYVRTMLTNYQDSGKDFSYSVRVDDRLPIISRSKKIDLFDTVKEHITEETCSVTVTIHKGSSLGGDSMTLVAEGKELPPKPEKTRTGQALAGFDKEAERENLRKQLETEYEIKHLREENKRLNAEVKKSEAFAREVDMLIAKLHARRDKLQDKGILQTLGDFAGKFAATNPEALKGIPFSDFIVGLLPSSKTAPEQKDQEEQPVDGMVSISAKGAGETLRLPEAESQQLEEWRELKENFSANEFKLCTNLLYLLTEDKQLIYPACRWVKLNIDQRKQVLAQASKPKSQPQVRVEPKPQPQVEQVEQQPAAQQQTDKEETQAAEEPQAQTGETDQEQVSPQDTDFAEPPVTWQ